MIETLSKANGRINTKRFVENKGIMLGLTLFLLKRVDKILKTVTRDCQLREKDNVEVFYDPNGQKPTLVHSSNCNICSHSKISDATPCKIFHRA